MSRVVYYSLFVPPADPRPDLLRQLVSSVHSLRVYNRHVPIAVFVHGDVPRELPAALDGYGVQLCPQERYEARLARLCPFGWQVLARYPLLHKFLNFAEIAAMQPEQVLFLDCDTLFFGDVDDLFARYTAAHCYAREEPTCRRSHHGYDPSYVDEDMLSRVATCEGIQPAAPFNLGVVLFNHGVWNTLAALDVAFVSYAWRLMLWLALNPDQRRVAAFGETESVRWLRAQLHRWQSPERFTPLPFPSANEWIVDQVALWLTIGHAPGLTCHDFSAVEVLQNGEFLSHRARAPGAILCHYFTQNMQRMEQWLHASACVTCP